MTKSKYQQISTVDEILDAWHTVLGDDFTLYKNHCYRVYGFCMSLSPHCSGADADKVAIACAFHDLGIWSGKTFDYLETSCLLAREYLAQAQLSAWGPEIEAMIMEHHKLTRYRVHRDWLVEQFRKADWIDVTRGRLRFGLPQAVVDDMYAAFPDAGFRKKLLGLTKERFKQHPFRPLPMMKF